MPPGVVPVRAAACSAEAVCARCRYSVVVGTRGTVRPVDDERPLNNTEPVHEHVAVLQQEMLQALAIEPTGIYVDGTYGRGGHSQLILKQLQASGRLIALDQDPEAIADGEWRFHGEPRFSLFKRNFAELESVAAEQGVVGKVNGIVLDLGVSSPQLDNPSRGFSFTHEGELDMRMDTEHGQSAASWWRNQRVSA